MKIFVALVAFVMSWLHCASAAAPRPLTNEDVLKMTKAELPETTIILAIHNAPSAFDLAPDALIALKTAGVGRAVIEAMLTPYEPTASPPAAAAAAMAFTPTEAEVRELLAVQAKEDSQGQISIVSFRKTNGMTGSVNGIPTYRMLFEVGLKFASDSIWRNITVDSQLTFLVAPLQQQRSGSLAAFAEVATNPGLRVNRGDVLVAEGTIELLKTENGWKPGDLYHGKIRVAQESDFAPVRTPDVQKPAAVEPLPSAISAEELTKQLATPPANTGCTFVSFKGKSGKFSCDIPSYLEFPKYGEGDPSTYFETPGTTAGGIDGDMLMVTYQKKGFFFKRLTTEEHLVAELKATREMFQESNISGPVPIKFAGKDGVCYVVAGRKTGVVFYEVLAFTVTEKCVAKLLLFSTKERFAERWEDFKHVLASYVLHGE